MCVMRNNDGFAITRALITDKHLRFWLINNF